MYECHITIEENLNHYSLQTLIENLGWKYSRIDGDPILGKGIKHYATHHFNPNRISRDVIEIMNKAANTISNEKFKVVRQKVELIIYDTKKN